MNGLKNYWRSLSSRERLLVGGASALVLVSVFYFLLWEPWHIKLERLRVQVPEKIQTLEWMKAQQLAYSPLLAKAQKPAAKNTGGPLLTVIEQSATQANIRQFVNRIQPGENNQVQVWLEDTPFDPWLKWIAVLNKQGIGVNAVSVNKAEANKVSIRVTLQRA